MEEELNPKTDRDKIKNSGFTEAEADEFFAALVKLDQILGGTVGGYDNNTGELIRSQGDLFNSALHFIGFGRGATVNSEIIQRLGTYYPNAGGVSSESRDLQMTTIDAPTETPLSGSNGNIFDLKVQVWSNVTFADNYYQTRTMKDAQENEVSPAGTALSQADWQVELDGYAGFNNLEAGWGGHQKALAWYLLTNNVNAYAFPALNVRVQV